MCQLNPLIEFLENSNPPWLVTFTCHPGPGMHLGGVRFVFDKYFQKDNIIYLEGKSASAYVIEENLLDCTYHDNGEFSIAYRGAVGDFGEDAYFWFFYFTPNWENRLS